MSGYRQLLYHLVFRTKDSLPEGMAHLPARMRIWKGWLTI